MRGKITISQPHTNIPKAHVNAQGDYVHIRVEDETSHIAFLDLEMSVIDFAYAIMGRAHQECTFTLRNLANVGKKLEVKRERVPYVRKFDIGSMAETAAKIEALKPFEIDGWKGSADDLGNWHNGNETEGYLVHFRRYVDAADDAK